MGIADLTSATSYFGRTGVASPGRLDIDLLVPTAAVRRSCRVAYAERDPSHQFSQEIRLTSHDIGGLHWVAGAFYSNLNSVWNEIGRIRSPRPPQVPDGSFFTSWNSYGVRQTALFADGILQIHRSVETLRGRPLLPVQEPPGRVLVGPRRPESHAARRTRRSLTLRTAARIRESTSRTAPTPDLTAYAHGRPRVSGRAAPIRSCRRRLVAAYCHGGRAAVRPGFGLELRTRREGADLRQLAHRQQRRLLHQMDRHAAGVHAALRLSVLQQCRQRPLLRTRDSRSTPSSPPTGRRPSAAPRRMRRSRTRMPRTPVSSRTSPPSRTA